MKTKEVPGSKYPKERIYRSTRSLDKKGFRERMKSGVTNYRTGELPYLIMTEGEVKKKPTDQLRAIKTALEKE